MIELRHRAAGRHLADPPAGRPDARHAAIRSITVRVSYAGVGPLEMEELVTRPDRAGGQRRRRPRPDQLDLVRGQQHRPPELHLGHRPQRGGRRRAHPPRPRARPPAGRRRPADDLQVRLDVVPDHGHRRRGQLRPGHAARDGAERPVAAPRARAGVAAVSVDGGLRRQIRVDLSREKITALNLSVDRVVQILRTENQNIPLGEVVEADRMLPAPQPGPVHEHRRDSQPRRHDQGRRAGLPARHRRGPRHDRRPPQLHAHQRQARHPHARHQAVGHQHRADRRGRARARSTRINREVPNIKLLGARRPVACSSAARSTACRSTRCSAACWSSLIIFVFLRDLALDAHHLHVDSDLGRSAPSRCSTSAATR